MPFPLPDMPQGLRWSKQQRANLQTAFSSLSNDVVTTCLILNEIKGAKHSGLKSKNIAWLDQAVSSVKADALKTLHADFSEASEKGDLRGIIFAAKASSSIATNSIENAPVKIKQMVQDYSNSPSAGGCIWITTNTSYSDQGRFYSDRLGTLQAPDGFKIIRVKTEARNRSREPDPLYAKRIFLDFANDRNTSDSKQFRTCSSKMVVLATSSSRWIKASRLSGAKHNFKGVQIFSNQATTVPRFRGIPPGYTLSMDWAQYIRSQVVERQVLIDRFWTANWQSGQTDSLDILFIVPATENQYTLLLY